MGDSTDSILDRFSDDELEALAEALADRLNMRGIVAHDRCSTAISRSSQTGKIGIAVEMKGRSFEAVSGVVEAEFDRLCALYPNPEKLPK